jgi:hypothetical protein
MGSLDRTYPKNRSMNERRRLWRYPFDLDASTWPRQGSSQAVRLVDIGVEGAGIVVGRVIDPGQTGVLRIDLAQGASLRLPYKVLWAQTINGLKRCGLRLFLIDSVKVQLATFIDGVTGG